MAAVAKKTKKRGRDPIAETVKKLREDKTPLGDHLRKVRDDNKEKTLSERKEQATRLFELIRAEFERELLEEDAVKWARRFGVVDSVGPYKSDFHVKWDGEDELWEADELQTLLRQECKVNVTIVSLDFRSDGTVEIDYTVEL